VKKLAFRGVAILALCAGIATVLVSAATAKPTKSVQVCVLLPDTKSSVRWVQFDAPDIAKALKAAGVTGLSVTDIRGFGRQGGHTEVYRGREYSVDLIPKTKIEMVLPDAMVEKAEQAILTAARTGKIGDGKIFRSHIDEAIRIRNDERGEGAL